MCFYRVVRLVSELLLFLLLALPSGMYAEESILSVCDVLEQRLQYDGKSVPVFGHAGHTMEGLWLTDDCGAKLLIDGEVWGYDIWLAYSGSGEPPAPNLPDGFRWNHERLIAPIPLLRNPNKYDLLDDPSCERRSEWIAVFGRFETRNVFPKITYASGETRNIGFGHLGGSPAQLIFQEGGRFCLTLEKQKPEVDRARDPWLRIGATLLGDDGFSYFENGLKGTLVPKLKGTVVSSLPDASPRTLVLQMDGSPLPDVTLRLDRPYGKPIVRGSSIYFEGVAAELSRSPFMLTFDVSLDGLAVALGK